MDDDKRFVINIMPSVKIPQDQYKFQAYLDKVVTKTDNNGSKKPCVLQELIEGVKFTVNVICKNGRILTLQVKFLSKLYPMSHRVLPTFKLVYGHLNGNFLTGNFTWAFARQFENSGQKDFAKF